MTSLTETPAFDRFLEGAGHNLIAEALALYEWLTDSNSTKYIFSIDMFIVTLNAAASARLAGDHHLEGLLLGKSRDFGVLRGELLLRYVCHQRALRPPDLALIRDAIVGLSEAKDTDTYEWCRREVAQLAVTTPEEATKLRRLSVILGLCI